MYLQYGTYIHPLGEAAVAISRESIYSEALDRYAGREHWEIQGLLIEPTGDPVAMSKRIATLETAYAYEGRDIGILLPNGQLSCHYILTAETIGGVRVVRPPAYPEGRGAENVTVRTFTVAVEALVPVIAGAPAVLSFEESVSLIPSGPRYGHIETLTGWPVKQLLRQHTVARATQRGQAVGLYSYPFVPAALWPYAMAHMPEISRRSPRRRGGTYIEYPVSWSYEYESAMTMAALPNFWTI